MATPAWPVIVRLSPEAAIVSATAAAMGIEPRRLIASGKEAFIRRNGPCSVVSRDGSWVQRLEFLPRCPEVAELVDRRRSWREREYIKRLGEHPLEVVLGCDAYGDVRIELLAGCFWDERRDVVDGRLVDLRSGVVTYAAAVPVFSVKGATASISSCCNLKRSSVGSTTMPPRPMSFQGM